MSFSGYKTLVEEGDQAIIYLSVKRIYAVRVEKDKVFQTGYGAIRLNDLIGRQWGSFIHCPTGWAYILHPTPELWTITLPHRTQILYTPDISLVTLELQLRPGSVVIEAGTGSGSLSHALTRTILPTGHLYTFDFHEGRVALAQAEFSDHGLGNVVTVGHRDVVKDGFGCELDGKADAVFLDLPLPWHVISAAKRAIKSQGGRVCSFSPCIEQVQKTCLALAECGFVEISTQEYIQKPMDVMKIEMPKLVLDKVSPAVPEKSPVVEDSMDVKSPPSKRRANLPETEPNPEPGPNPEPEQNLEPNTEERSEQNLEPNTEESSEQNLEPNTEESSEEFQRNITGDRDVDGCRDELKGFTQFRRCNKRKRKAIAGPSVCFMSAVPHRQLTGHTGYLTFATLYQTTEA